MFKTMNIFRLCTLKHMRLLLLMNTLIFLVLLFTLYISFTHSEKNFNSGNKFDEKQLTLNIIENRLQKLQQALKNRFPSAVDYIDVHVKHDLPTIYAITPTYKRWTQKADLTRLGQTLLHVPNFRWIVVEDSNEKTALVTNFLKFSGLQYTHLNAKTDQNYKLKSTDPNWLLPRGVAQRNKGLTWIRKNLSPHNNGILYFLDDDNTYSLRVFEEMRSTEVASVWPVGLSGGLKFEGPGKCKDGKVLEWYTAWKPERPFPIDMAGFAVNLKLLFKYSEAEYSNDAPRGYLESHFLTGLKLKRHDMEAKADNCSKVLVWHTRTEKPKMKQEEALIRQGKSSNSEMEV
uniref:Galactosylgalactosylxylosylprotein 3-beta-glucuronosyltransferase n=1 Tax=Ciona savignyi TaxID=51511 RepID=Q5CAR8_CIOSA|nr:beta3-glucuronyltransferase [Ciona savignyi]